MGLSLQVGHPRTIFVDDYADLVLSALHEAFGPNVPLGSPNQYFCLPDEIGWSDWSDLQTLAAKKLGAGNALQIMAIDAWKGVYLDVDVDRAVLWPDGVSGPANLNGTKQKNQSVFGGSRLRRVLHKMGLLPDPEQPTAIQEILMPMMKAYGPREGEENTLQVGNIKSLFVELEALLECLGIERNEHAVEMLRRS